MMMLQITLMLHGTPMEVRFSIRLASSMCVEQRHLPFDPAIGFGLRSRAGLELCKRSQYQMAPSSAPSRGIRTAIPRAILPALHSAAWASMMSSSADCDFRNDAASAGISMP